MSSDPKEPTPLSADKRYPIEIIQGVEGFCIGVNNYRLVGPKPWGGGTVVKRWNVSLADLGRAIPELSATIDAKAIACSLCAWLSTTRGGRE